MVGFEKAYCEYRLNRVENALKTIQGIPEQTDKLKELYGQVVRIVWFAVSVGMIVEELWVDAVVCVCSCTDWSGTMSVRPSIKTWSETLRMSMKRRGRRICQLCWQHRAPGRTRCRWATHMLNMCWFVFNWSCDTSLTCFVCVQEDPGLPESSYELCYNAACCLIGQGQLSQAMQKLQNAEGQRSWLYVRVFFKGKYCKLWVVSMEKAKSLHEWHASGSHLDSDFVLFFLERNEYFDSTGKH